MKIYIQDEEISQQPFYSIMVCPAADHPDEPNFLGPDKKPITFDVKFRFGVAEVDKPVGDYMVKRKLASRSRIVMPS